jgi:ubiquinone/menaquinone biosynthesis C-methylase UbiE
MNTLQEYWNRSTAKIVPDKDPSIYAIEKEPHFPRNAIVCDLGGGTGTDSLFFASKGHAVRVVDISDIALSKATETAQKAGLQHLITTYQTDFTTAQLPLDSSSCDVVYSRLALHYFDIVTTSALFAEVYRVLKPGGQAHITVKSPDDEAEMRYLHKTATPKGDGIFDENGFLKTRFSVDQLKNIVTAAGVPAAELTVTTYVERFEGRKDTVKSGRSELLLNQVLIQKASHR